MGLFDSEVYIVLEPGINLESNKGARIMSDVMNL